MKHDLTSRESQELTALYALGALSQQEARALDEHLGEGCQVCDIELRQFDEVVGVLGSAAAPAVPPAYVRDLLTVRIQREVSEGDSPPASVIRFPEQPGSAQHKPASDRASLGAFLPWAIAAALLVAFVFSLTMWQSQRSSLQAQKDQDAAALKENSELRAQLSKESGTAAELTEINAVLSSPRWRIIPLAGQEPAPDSSAKIYWDVRGGRWVVTADLPPAPEGKVYQLWFVTPEAKISAGLISPDRLGHGFVVLQFPPDLGQLAAAAITLEPEGGSEQPTMPIYALGKA